MPTREPGQHRHWLEASAKDGSQLGSRARSLLNKVKKDREAMLKMHSKVPSLRGAKVVALSI